MIRINAAAPPAAPADRDPQALRKVADQLEAVFVTEMFKAMRAAVPEGGLGNGGAGEEIFTSMMDAHIAESSPRHGARGIAAAITRQLGGRS
jgi:flagellar protein FlgJ